MTSRMPGLSSPDIGQACRAAWVSGSPGGSTHSQREMVSLSTAVASPILPTAAWTRQVHPAGQRVRVAGAEGFPESVQHCSKICVADGIRPAAKQAAASPARDVIVSGWPRPSTRSRPERAFCSAKWPSWPARPPGRLRPGGPRAARVCAARALYLFPCSAGLGALLPCRIRVPGCPNQVFPMSARPCWMARVSGSPGGKACSQRSAVSRSRASASPVRPTASYTCARLARRASVPGW